MNTLASILVALLSSVLKVWLQQAQAAKDAKAVGTLTAFVNDLEAHKRALSFKVEAARDPLDAGDLRLRDDAHAVRVPGADPGVDRPPD